MKRCSRWFSTFVCLTFVWQSQSSFTKQLLSHSMLWWFTSYQQDIVEHSNALREKMFDGPVSSDLVRFLPNWALLTCFGTVTKFVFFWILVENKIITGKYTDACMYEKISRTSGQNNEAFICGFLTWIFALFKSNQLGLHTIQIFLNPRLRAVKGSSDEALISQNPFQNLRPQSLSFATFRDLEKFDESPSVLSTQDSPGNARVAYEFKTSNKPKCGCSNWLTLISLGVLTYWKPVKKHPGRDIVIPWSSFMITNAHSADIFIGLIVT